MNPTDRFHDSFDMILINEFPAKNPMPIYLYNGNNTIVTSFFGAGIFEAKCNFGLDFLAPKNDYGGTIVRNRVVEESLYKNHCIAPIR